LPFRQAEKSLQPGAKGCRKTGHETVPFERQPERRDNMGKTTRTRRTLIAADMARMLRELQKASANAPAARPAQRPASAGGRILVDKGK
jgi:hypothetical protein